MVPDGHRTAERRSLALHAAVLERLDEAILQQAVERVAGWLRDEGPAPAAVAHAWTTLLTGDRGELARALVRDDEQMRDLRQNTPFAGVVDAAERWRIIREVR